MPGQELRLYKIFAKVNERSDGTVCPRADTARRSIACDRDPLQFVSGLLSVLELFFIGLGESMTDSVPRSKQDWLLLVGLFCFFFSGAAGLIYQVVWTRMLTQIFGNTTYAIATVLSAFMAGLAIGSYLFGQIADRGKNDFLLYGILEAGVGVFYATNTLGAVIGCGAGGFFLIPTLGMRMTVFVAASVNLVIAAAILLIDRLRDKTPLEIVPPTAAEETARAESQGSSKLAWVVLTSFALSGFASLV